jgi:hypothetical protein
METVEWCFLQQFAIAGSPSSIASARSAGNVWFAVSSPAEPRPI